MPEYGMSTSLFSKARIKTELKADKNVSHSGMGILVDGLIGQDYLRASSRTLLLRC